MSLLASKFDEWASLYPCLSLFAGIAFVFPVSKLWTGFLNKEQGKNHFEK